MTATSSTDPVLRGEWLKPGATVCAVGANRIQSRELDNAVLERATFVCCDSREQALLEAGDLVEPVERGVLDWLEVYELSEVVAGEVAGRASDEDIVLFKSVGIARGGPRRRKARPRPRPRARHRPRALALRVLSRAIAAVSSPIARITSGRSSSRRRCSSLVRS